MSIRLVNVKPQFFWSLSRFRRWCLPPVLLGQTALMLATSLWRPAMVAAQQLNRYCQVSQATAIEKETLRRAAFAGDAEAQRQYEITWQQHADTLRQCRSRTWPRQQGVWLRLYPCDLQPGILEAVLDRIVNLGYNQVYVEVFYNGQVLLPQADNPTVWPTVVQTPGYERRDLLAEAITKGRDRGLQVHAWVFTLNFGFSYTQRADRHSVLARNGRGQDSLTAANLGLTSNPDEVFVDPYHALAQQDYRRLVQAVLRRRPDGVLFDYVRYPRGTGANSVASNVKDLWIYGEASRQSFLQRALNPKGRELMRRFLSRGYLIDADLREIDQRFSETGLPLWQTRVPPDNIQEQPLSTRRLQLQNELWRFSVAHAVQGVIDFLVQAAEPVQQQGIEAGVVFFPDGNRTVGNGGYDSRLQYWDRFPRTLSWHPMAYSVCGHTGCILDDIRRVITMAGSGSERFVEPVIAGSWGRPGNNRPALETQMEAIQRALPQIDSLSHFAYSWQDPEFDRVRKFCELR